VKKAFLLTCLILLLTVLVACGDQSSAVPAAIATRANPTSNNPTTAITPTVAVKSTATPGITPVLNVAQRPFYEPIPTAQINQAKQEWLSLIDQAEQKWKAKGVTNYHIEISSINTTWKPIAIYKITVKNGQVIQQANNFNDPVGGGKSLTPYPTLASFDATKYTVPGLFAIARAEVNSQWYEGETAFAIEFDSAYGFPKKIARDNIHYTDTETIWEVQMFQVLA
jgi:hypothetical protein